MGPVGMDPAFRFGFRRKFNFGGHSCSVILITADWEGRLLSPVLELSMAFSRFISNSVIDLTPLSLPLSLV